MGIFWAMVMKFTLDAGLKGSSLGEWLLAMSEIGIFINILLAAFNLLPIPPLDGGRVLRGLVNESIGQYLDRIERFGFIIIVVLLVSGLLWVVVDPLRNFLTSLMIFVVRL